MKVKRPWTLGKYWPEEPLDEDINFQMILNGGGLLANEKLASMAPEMAELLISLVKNKMDWGKLIMIADDAEKLLKEVGYEPGME